MVLKLLPSRYNLGYYNKQWKACRNSCKRILANEKQQFRAVHSYNSLVLAASLDKSGIIERLKCKW